MSGIGGIVRLDGGLVEHEQLVTMIGPLQARGPDNRGAWQKQAVGLIHTMMYTSRESLSEHQPLVDSVGNCVLVADCRIDNRAELIHLLDCNLSASNLSVECGDSELILAAYLKWGKACVEKLIGDFTFCIWNQQTRRLFCARDHMGVKPFYYCYLPNKAFIFGSNIATLLASGLVPRRMNKLWVGSFLMAFRDIDETNTFLCDIKRLPAAHTLTMQEDGLSIERYWEIDVAYELSSRPPEEYVAEYRSLFEEAIRCRMRSVYPVGSMLSGGVDSTSIAHVASGMVHEAKQETLHTYSAISQSDPACRDTYNIRLMQQNLRHVTLHEIGADDLHAFRPEFHCLLGTTNNLFDYVFTHVLLGMFCTAKQSSVRVLLDGVDGDMVASYNSYYLTHLMKSGSWLSAVREARGLVTFHEQSRSVGKTLLSHAYAAYSPDRVLIHKLENRRRSAYQTHLRHSIIRPEFAEEIQLEEFYWQDNWMSRIPGPSPRAQASKLLFAPVRKMELEQYDALASMQGIEPRHPLYDKRLVEFCMALPWHQKRYEGWSKIIMRRAMANELPSEVIWSRHCPHLMSEFYRGWFNTNQGYFESRLASGLDEIAPFVRVDMVRESFRRYVNGGTEEDFHNVVSTLVFAAWFQRNGFTD